MTVYFCYFVKDDEWGSYVVAEGRGQAKAMFYYEFKDEGEWNDIRCFKVKDISDDISYVFIVPRCLDTPDDPALELLGLKYEEREY